MAPLPRPTDPGYPRTGGTEVPAQPDFPALERGVLEYWAASDTFRESVRQRPAGDEFVFYDGPPFANGLPHYGHLLTGYVKDLVPRFRTMQGKRVERRFGWDCHGLPAETEAEKELGVSGRGPITEFGIGRFNTDEEIDFVAERLIDLARKLRELSPEYAELA